MQFNIVRALRQAAPPTAPFLVVLAGVVYAFTEGINNLLLLQLHAWACVCAWALAMCVLACRHLLDDKPYIINLNLSNTRAIIS